MLRIHESLGGRRSNPSFLGPKRQLPVADSDRSSNSFKMHTPDIALPYKRHCVQNDPSTSALRGMDCLESMTLDSLPSTAREKSHGHTFLSESSVTTIIGNNLSAPSLMDHTSLTALNSSVKICKDWNKVDNLKNMIASPRRRRVATGDSSEDKNASYASRRFRSLSASQDQAMIGSQNENNSNTLSEGFLESQSLSVETDSIERLTAAPQYRIQLHEMDTIENQSSEEW